MPPFEFFRYASKMGILCDAADGDNEGPYLIFEEQEPREKDQRASRATERSHERFLAACRSSALCKITCVGILFFFFLFFRENSSCFQKCRSRGLI